MNEPGTPSALGIEAVEWLPGAGGDVTVRIRGRWRRGRPLSNGQPLLMIEARGRRNRYPAMPEPPSARGTAPGTWQITFSIPAALARIPDARAWLQAGAGVLVPLPVPTELAAPRMEAAEPPEPAPAPAEEPLEATLADLRHELDQLRDVAKRERVARAAAEARTTTLEGELVDQRSRSARAYEAVVALRAEVEQLATDARATLQPPSAVEPPAATAPPPSPRARPARNGAGNGTNNGVEAAPTRSGRPPAPSSGRWLERALRQLARRNPSLAGRLLVVLVPGAEMEQERLVELVSAGPLRRGRSWGRDSAAVDALKQRLAHPGSLEELRLEPGLSLVLAAVMIAPGWTAGERFTIAYELPTGGPPGPYLEVNDGNPVTVSGHAHPASISATVTCPADALIAVLAGRRPPSTEIAGDERPLELVRAWLERAQAD